MNPSVPPQPREGVVSWNMNTVCNYRCSYCTQRFLDDRRQWARDLPGFVAAFSQWPGEWEIKLSGGEPFLHPGFLEFVAAMAERNWRLSVVTNFSADQETLADFARLTRPRPGVFSASLHLEYVEPRAFLEKLVWMRECHAGRISATCVATRANLPRLPALVEEFAARGFLLHVQPEKQNRDVIDYTPEERAQLLTLGGHNASGWIDPDFQGRACWAGSFYGIVDHRGEAWRCYPARRHRQEYLGNLLRGDFQWRATAQPCLYRYCNCTVPQERGMVEV